MHLEFSGPEELDEEKLEWNDTLFFRHCKGFLYNSEIVYEGQDYIWTNESLFLVKLSDSKYYALIPVASAPPHSRYILVSPSEFVIHPQRQRIYAVTDDVNHMRIISEIHKTYPEKEYSVFVRRPQK